MLILANITYLLKSSHKLENRNVLFKIPDLAVILRVYYLIETNSTSKISTEFAGIRLRISLLP